jgi:NAD(P)-dependent dehydrogenase (short-subunit alcohol dehydrogenase family)
VNDAVREGVAFVTGGASGIGLRVVERLLESGRHVVAADRDRDGLERAERKLGSNLHPVVVDVTSEADIEAAIALARTLGELRVAVNVAGIPHAVDLVDQDLETWNRVIAVMLTGSFLSVKHEAREMRRLGKSAAIVNVSSISAHVPTWGSAAYSSAKAGIEALTRSAAYELAPHRIRVNAVAPGLVDTPMARGTGNSMPAVIERWIEHTPLGRIGTVDDVASAILYLVSDESAWITGQSLVLDGGMSHTAGPITRDLLKPS